MKIKAEQKNSRQSPRKVRLLANQVKDLSLEDAFTQLAMMDRKASIVLLKVMRQAVANAIHNHQLTIDQLEIDTILVKTGPTYKRWQPVSRGRAHSIMKRTCHVEVILKSKDSADEKEEKADEKVKNTNKNDKKATKSTKKVSTDSLKKKTTKKSAQAKDQSKTTKKIEEKKVQAKRNSDLKQTQVRAVKPKVKKKK